MRNYSYEDYNAEIFFIIDKANSLKEELDGQANDSADIINFRYVFTIDEIE